MDRIPLSDEFVELDDDVVEEEGTVGAEEQFKELDFDLDPETQYEPFDDGLFDDEDDIIDQMEADL